MRHFTKLPITYQGVGVYRLVDADGDFVNAFDDFSRCLFDQHYAPCTIIRYLNVVAALLDYLAERGVYTEGASESELNDALTSYISIRVHADRIRASTDECADEFFRKSKPIVEQLGFSSVESVDSIIAATNMYLRRSLIHQRTEIERAKHLGVQAKAAKGMVIVPEMADLVKLTSIQRKGLVQSSMLANVVRLNPAVVKRPRGLSRPRHHTFTDEESLDFPVLQLKGLIEAANTLRDKALWLCIAGPGLRTSEAVILRWEHIDMEARKIYVDDPNKLRYADELPEHLQYRFKGRATSETYILPFLKDALFQALEDYYKYEYVPGAGHEYVFQDIRNVSERGRPLAWMSDAARIENFKRAVARARVKPRRDGKTYTPQSLRHMYGVYLYNSLPVPGGYGLQIKEVQKIMGHTSEVTTMGYARAERSHLASKLAYSDQFVTSYDDPWESLPRMVARRLREQAAEVERGA